MFVRLIIVSFTIELSVSASETIRLDVAPYNTLQVQCNLSYYPTEANGLSVDFNVTSNVPSDDVSAGSSIQSSNTHTNTHTVTIGSADPDTVLAHMYTCSVDVSVTAVSPFTDNATSESVTVRGK